MYACECSMKAHGIIAKNVFRKRVCPGFNLFTNEYATLHTRPGRRFVSAPAIGIDNGSQQQHICQGDRHNATVQRLEKTTAKAPNSLRAPDHRIDAGLHAAEAQPFESIDTIVLQPNDSPNRTQAPWRSDPSVPPRVETEKPVPTLPSRKMRKVRRISEGTFRAKARALTEQEDSEDQVDRVLQKLQTFDVSASALPTEGRVDRHQDRAFKTPLAIRASLDSDNDKAASRSMAARKPSSKPKSRKSVPQQVLSAERADSMGDTEEIRQANSSKYDQNGKGHLGKRKTTSKLGTHVKTEKEDWKVQKDALSSKFGNAGWQPRKRLSPDTLEGIRSLHLSDPEVYSTETLSQHFRVSPEAIRRILKSKWRPQENEVEARRIRWEKRGIRKWQEMADHGVKPPAKWRAAGVKSPFHLSSESRIANTRRRRSAETWAQAVGSDQSMSTESSFAARII